MNINILKLLILISTLASFGIVITSIYKRYSPKSLYLTLLAFAITFYTLGYLLEADSASFEEAWYALILSQIGMPFIAPFALLFALDYYGYKIRRQYYLIFIAPITSFLLFITWPYNGLYYSALEYLPGPPISALYAKPSLFYILNFGFMFSLLAVLIIVVVVRILRLRGTERNHEFVTLIAVLLPVISALLSLTHIIPYNYDLTPIILTLSVALLAYSIFHLNLPRLMPLAKEKMLEKMNDAFIVFDKENRYRDANAAAIRLFPALQSAKPGTALSAMDELPAFLRQTPESGHEFLADTPGGNRYYRTSLTKIYHREKMLCICMMFYDITENKMLMDELNRLATYDSLTQIYNRGTFMKLAAHEFEQARASKYKLLIMMLDIDYFKKVNDTYGHLCGDLVLKNIAQRLKRRLRQSDIFGRYGGEEFCVCLTDISTENALNLAENLRSIVESETFEYGKHTLSVTISIGLSEYDPLIHESLEDLIRDTDTALYTAKQGGRNRVQISSKNQNTDNK